MALVVLRGLILWPPDLLQLIGSPDLDIVCDALLPPSLSLLSQIGPLLVTLNLVPRFSFCEKKQTKKRDCQEGNVINSTSEILHCC